MNPAESSWPILFGHLLELPVSTPPWLVASLGLILIYLVVILPSSVLIAYLDRKLGADFQARVGPNRSGPAGIFQPVADFLKLLQKDAVRRGNKEKIWLALQSMALYSTVAVLPLGSLCLLVDTDMSSFLPFWAALLVALGTLFLGFSQKTAAGWLGGVRVAAQAMAAAFPALVSILCAGVKVGGFRWSLFAKAQGAIPFFWTAFSNPFQFVAFVVFVISGLILLGIPPMDAPLSNPDLQGGISSRFFGRNLGLFQLGRFYSFFLWSVIAVVLFLGAWILPESLVNALNESQNFQALQILELLWLLGKTFGLMILVIWVARVNPRSRVDQITDFAWKILSPSAIGALVGASLWAAWSASG